MDTKKEIEPGQPAQAKLADGALGCIGLVVIVIAGFFVLKSCSDFGASVKPSQTVNRKVVRAVDDLIKAGVIKKVRGTDYWIDPFVWMAFDRDKKEQMILMVQQHSIAKTTLSLVAIRSYSNDEVLGEVSMLGGVTINR